MKKALSRLVAGLMAGVLCISLCPSPAKAASSVSVKTKYLYSGAAHAKYTNLAYYAEPVVADINKDGRDEVVSVSFAITVTDAQSGKTLWQVDSGKDRSTPYNSEPSAHYSGAWCSPVVKDIDGDGYVEIISTHKNLISVLDHNGYFKKGWPKYLEVDSFIRSLAVDDFDGDGTCEIVVGAGVNSEASVWVYDCYGVLFPHWPQLSPDQQDQAESYGIFANGISTGDIDGDGLPEIIAPTDNRCIQAFELDGSLIMADAETFGDSPWGSIRTYIDYDHEKTVAQRGWDTDQGKVDMKERLCMEFGHAGSVIDDLDGDGKNEVVVTGIVMDTNSISNAFWLDSLCMSVAIFNGDRTRYQNTEKGFDWTTIPTNLGARIKDCQNSGSSFVLPEPVTADLDGDGNKEILFNSFDGKLYCFSLDQTMKSFTLPATTSTIAEYAAQPTCVDINGDGKKEIIFGSWTDSITSPNHDTTSENTGVNGSLYILDSDLKLISRTQLPAEYPGYLGAYQTNGVKAAPAVKDVDGDGEYEVILNTSYRSVCAYDLVGSTIYDTPFTDMRWHWAKDYVNTCVKRGYFNGTGNNTFTPSGTMTRGMLATVLYRMAGSPQVTIDNPFTDVPAGQWYTNGAIWCYEKGILANMDSTTMDPNALVTRQELAYMLYQYSGAPKEPSSALTDFSDSASVSDWAQDAMEYCVGLGVLQGSEGKLNPQNSVTRAEAAAMLVRFADAQ